MFKSKYKHFSQSQMWPIKSKLAYKPILISNPTSSILFRGPTQYIINKTEIKHGSNVTFYMLREGSNRVNDIFLKYVTPSFIPAMI